MKRGRPNIRARVQTLILDNLSSSQTPLTISTITRFISKNLERKISWNTTQKYLQELVEANKVQAIQLPHSKVEKKIGLTVYILKK